MLQRIGDVELPSHAGAGAFDHAAVHRRSGLVYVAHTANDAVDVIDGAAGRCVESIGGLAAVAGALVSDEHDVVFTSNRGEDSVGMFAAAAPAKVVKVGVGVKPNGLAYDPVRRRLLAANVGDPARPGSFTVSLIDVDARRRLAEIPVPGRTRWTVWDPAAEVFHVNVMDPPVIVVVDAGRAAVTRTVDVPSAGPHGLDLDVTGRRLFCACDAARLVELDADTGTVVRTAELAGVPDVIFFNAALARLYVAVGDPGVIEVFDTQALRRVETVVTEKGAHTLAFDAARNLVYALLPQTHRAAVYVDRG
jgi:DNA-binding beta-propeller fold protein YncE